MHRKSVTITVNRDVYGHVRIRHGRNLNRALYDPAIKWLQQMLEYRHSVRLSLTSSRQRGARWQHVMCVGRFSHTVFYVRVDAENTPLFDQPIIALCEEGLSALFGHIPTFIAYKEKA